MATSVPRKIRIGPQPGPQEAFLASEADIAIYGGAAGSGKSWALLLEPIRHANNGTFGCVCFRRTTPQIRNEGGLWDESMKLYTKAHAVPTAHTLQWKWPSGASLTFAHLEYDKTVYDWQGSQIPLLMFDELTHFSQSQFWYMLSRNRSMCGVRPYVRATCNPDPDSFVARLIEWWIDQETGYAIPERSGKIRWFVRVNDTLHWSGSQSQLKRDWPDAGEPKSLTFIAASIHDNQALMVADPGYLANLNALRTTERERLLKGNWRIRDERTVIFKPSWWRRWSSAQPLPKILHSFASWDTAFTAADQRIQAGGKPVDQSAIAFSACLVFGIWLDEADVTDSCPGGRHKLMLLSAWWGRVDWPDLRAKVYEIGKTKLTQPSDAHLIEQAASGRSVIQDLRRSRKTNCRVIGVKPTSGDGRLDAKVLRAYLSQPVLKDGLVWAPDRKWVQPAIDWLASFPGGTPPSADLADCLSMAIQHLAQGWWIHHPDDDIPAPEKSDDDEDLDDDDLGWAERLPQRGRAYG
jgi:phage terminase large subunit-like protein